jgi:hypothetical protein
VVARDLHHEDETATRNVTSSGESWACGAGGKEVGLVLAARTLPTAGALLAGGANALIPNITQGGVRSDANAPLGVAGSGASIAGPVLAGPLTAATGASFVLTLDAAPDTDTRVRAGAPPLREKPVRSVGRQKTKARRTLSLPLSTYSARGGLPQDPGHGAESSADATTCGNGGTTCVCCCRCTGDAVTSNQWWDRQGSWGCSARRCGGARGPTGRSGRPTRQREGSDDRAVRVGSSRG